LRNENVIELFYHQKKKLLERKLQHSTIKIKCTTNLSKLLASNELTTDSHLLFQIFPLTQSSSVAKDIK